MESFVCTVRAGTIVNKSGIKKKENVEKNFRSIDKAINIILQPDLKNLVVH